MKLYWGNPYSEIQFHVYRLSTIHRTTCINTFLSGNPHNRWNPLTHSNMMYQVKGHISKFIFQSATKSLGIEHLSVCIQQSFTFWPSSPKPPIENKLCRTGWSSTKMCFLFRSKSHVRNNWAPRCQKGCFLFFIYGSFQSIFILFSLCFL